MEEQALGNGLSFFEAGTELEDGLLKVYLEALLHLQGAGWSQDRPADVS